MAIIGGLAAFVVVAGLGALLWIAITYKRDDPADTEEVTTQMWPGEQ